MNIKNILEEFNNFLSNEKEGQTEEDMVTAETAIEEKGEEAEKADMEQAEYKEIEPKKVETETIAKGLLEEFKMLSVSPLTEDYDLEDLKKKVDAYRQENNLQYDFEIKQFDTESEEFQKLRDVADKVSENSPIKLRVEDTYFDYGQNWLWTTLIAIHEKANGTSTWQAIYPTQQAAILAGYGQEVADFLIEKYNQEYGINETFDKDFPKEELSDKVKDALACLFDLDEEGNTYITAEDFIEYIEDLKQENPELLDEIKLDLGADFDKLLNKELSTLTFINESLNEDMDLLSKDATFRYMMLDRLRTDCGYFLGNGNRNEKNLWAGNVEKQIQLMKDLYNSFEEKPEWISMEEIEDYEKQMKQTEEAINEISDELAQEVKIKRQHNALKAELAARDAAQKATKSNKLYNRWKKSKQESLEEDEINPSDIHCILAKELPAEDLDHYASDLYVRKTEKSTQILSKLKYKNNGLLTTFIDNIEGKEWYELPFCYNPNCEVTELGKK